MRRYILLVPLMAMAMSVLWAVMEVAVGQRPLAATVLSHYDDKVPNTVIIPIVLKNRGWRPLALFGAEVNCSCARFRVVPDSLDPLESQFAELVVSLNETRLPRSLRVRFVTNPVSSSVVLNVRLPYPSNQQ